ncbi:MAG: hypothetical protein ACFCBU_06000 [Cyanophyceae cyanobacterium]
MRQQHQPVQTDFDSWDVSNASNAVGLVELEASEIGDRSEPLERPLDPSLIHPFAAPLDEALSSQPHQNLTGRSLKVKPRESRPSLKANERHPELPRGMARKKSPVFTLDATPPGALSQPVYEPFPDPFAPINAPSTHVSPVEVESPEVPQPRSPVRHEVADSMTGKTAVRILQRFLVWRWTRLMQWLPWKMALLSTTALGSCALLVAAVRWQPGEPVTRTGLRDECLAVTNFDGTVPSAKADGVGKLVGKSRQELTKNLGAPYCQLPKTSVRSGAILDRSLYQLEGDRQMVVAFEGDRTVGYAVDPPADGNVHGTGDRHDFDLRQSWGWLPGAQVSDRAVIGGLGSIALAMDGPVYAPVDGVVYEQAALVAEGQLSRLPSSCAVFSSVQLPAYAVQLCGLRDRQVGAVKQGQEIGNSERFLHLAVLRRDGNQWMFVPPSPEIVEQVLGSAT